MLSRDLQMLSRMGAIFVGFFACYSLNHFDLSVQFFFLSLDIAKSSFSGAVGRIISIFFQSPVKLAFIAINFIFIGFFI